MVQKLKVVADSKTIIFRATPKKINNSERLTDCMESTSTSTSKSNEERGRGQIDDDDHDWSFFTTRDLNGSDQRKKQSECERNSREGGFKFENYNIHSSLIEEGQFSLLESQGLDIDNLWISNFGPLAISSERADNSQQMSSTSNADFLIPKVNSANAIRNDNKPKSVQNSFQQDPRNPKQMVYKPNRVQKQGPPYIQV